jgi:hypothetical protein
MGLKAYLEAHAHCQTRVGWGKVSQTTGVGRSGCLMDLKQESQDAR